MHTRYYGPIFKNGVYRTPRLALQMSFYLGPNWAWYTLATKHQFFYLISLCLCYYVPPMSLCHVFFTLVTWSQHKVFFRVFVTWRYVAKHGGHLLEQCSLEQKADFYRHLNRIVILPSGLLSCFFDFTYPSPHSPHFPPIISSHSPPIQQLPASSCYRHFEN